MLDKITDDEILIGEVLYYPVGLAETLFDSLDTLNKFTLDNFGEVRLGQYPMLSFAMMMDDDENVSRKDNFIRKKHSSDLYCMAGRNFGKSLISIIVDILINMMHGDNLKVIYSSYDYKHVQDILNVIFFALNLHPFFQLFEPRMLRNPYTIELINGYHLDGVNMKAQMTKEKAGADFFGKHAHYIYIDESSKESYEVYNKRQESKSELGSIERLVGMTDFVRKSPAGDKYYDNEVSTWVMTVPQFINPNWNEEANKKAIKDYGGETSLDYRMFVLGEVVEDVIGVYDMARVRERCYDDSKNIKRFEINKNNLSYYRDEIVLDPFKNANKIFLCADVSDKGITEIIILHENNGKYIYDYNITCNNLAWDELLKIFEYCIKEVNANIIAIDSSDALGRTLVRELTKMFGVDAVIPVGFNEKIAIGEVYDENGHLQFERDGNIKMHYEYVVDWSIKRLKDLLYRGKFKLPIDDKFDRQFSQMITIQGATRLLYKSTRREDDHEHQSFQCMAIAEWLTEFRNKTPKTGIYYGGFV